MLSEERSHFTRELEGAGLLREMELTLKRKDGRHISVLDSARVIRAEDGQVMGFWGVLTDITERRRIEDRLRQTQFAVDHAADDPGDVTRFFSASITHLSGRNTGPPLSSQHLQGGCLGHEDDRVQWRGCSESC